LVEEDNRALEERREYTGAQGVKKKFARRRRVMKKRIVGVLCILFILAFAVLSNSWAAGEKYPTGTISNISLFAPGSQPDLFNRILSRSMERFLKVPVVTVNKPGGGGAIGFSALANARPDGYTIGVGTAENMIVPTLVEGKPPYSLDDLYILGQIATIYNVLVVAPDAPWKTWQEFVDYARKNPGVKYGCPGIRSTFYMRLETLNKNANLGLIAVPFDDDSQVKIAVMGHTIPLGAWDLGSARELQAAGKVKIIFIFESPTAAGLDPQTAWLGNMEKNVVEKDIDISHCLVVHKNTPNEIKQVLKGTLEKVVKDPEFLADLKKMELMINYLDGNTVIQKKLPQRLEQVKAFYKERGWIK
jgi:tripartite-type tricarboxylate transporter receptor subunit TctC